MFSLTECTQEAHSPQAGFQYIVLPLWSTVDALTDADSVVRSTTIAVSKTASVASYRSRYVLPVMMIAKTEMCT